MFKGLGNLASMMKQAQQMKSRMEQVQGELGSLKVEGTAGGGMVTVEATGQQKVLSIKIDPSLLKVEEQEMLEELTAAAVNQALDKARTAAAEAMQQVAGGMDIPGLNDALSDLGVGNGTE